MSARGISSSDWITYSNRSDSSNIRVRTDFGGRQPVSVSFECSRIQSPLSNSSTIYINPDIYSVFINAITGKAHEDMTGNPHSCSSEYEAGHCGNMRGHLAECRCEDLNRKTKPFMRLQFENHVIGKIVNSSKILNAQRDKTQFQFNLAIFCSGGLLGEEVLLFRLFNELRKKSVSGTINLFLIDKCYKKAIETGDPSQAINLQKDLDQFLREICGCLPSSLKVNGSVFCEASEYITSAQSDSRLKHDLLIGADIEGTEKIIAEISSNTCMFFGQAPIVLVRKDNKRGIPSVCDVDAFGELANCYAPISTPPPSRRSNAGKSDQRVFWEVPALASAAGIALIALVIILASGSRRH